MEKKPFNPIANNDHTCGILRSSREIPPADYLFKIESFSLLVDSEIEKYESGVFESGGYKWRLSLYPNGNVKRNGNGHISLYLALTETDSLPLRFEVNVNFKLFVFDHTRDNFITIQDANVRRFNRLNTEWGFDQLLSLETFNDPCNGYLIGDSCVFGAEVFVIKSNWKGECLSFINDPDNSTYTWKIDKFSKSDETSLRSEEFIVGEHKWKLVLYPKGSYTFKGKNLSLYLDLADLTLPSERKLYAKYKLRVRDQVNGINHEHAAKRWFCSSITGWGHSDFLSLSDLNDTSKGFIVNDTLIVEVQFMVMSVFKDI